MSEHARTTRPSQRGYRGILLRRQEHGIQPASAAAHGAPAPDGVVVRPAAAGAYRHAHNRVVGVRPVRRPAPDAGGHRSGRRQGTEQSLRLQRYRRARRHRKCASCALDESGAYWIDYVADVGDGFESTYTTGLPAGPGQPRRARRGQAAARRNPDHGRRSVLSAGHARGIQEAACCSLSTGRSASREPDRKLFAIPGNHDWYDGLTAFDSLFCSSRDKLSNAKGNIIGGWQCQQHRSYWALRLPYNWWIWGADIQFSKYLDTAQVNYFERVAEQMGANDNLIICLAEPSWMLADLQGQDEEENFFKITTIARASAARAWSP